jgi:hypothetical protein
MQVLLFLTALLSALTGVIAGPHGDESRLARAEQRLVGVVAEVAPAASVALRPLAGFAPLVRKVALPYGRAPVPTRPTLVGTVLLIE